MKKLKYISAAFILLAGVLFGASHVSAMASYFFAPTKSAAATTTLSWITPGTGTTTITLPTPLSLGMGTKYDSARVMIQVTATTSAPNGKVNSRTEYSFDGIDWYSETVASSSQNVTGLMPQEMSFNIATTSNYINNGSTNRMNFSYIIDTPTPYTRVVIYSPIGGTNLSVWAAVQPIKQSQVINQ